MEELLEGMKSQASGFFPTADGIASEPLTRLTMFAFGFGGVGQYIYSLVLGFFMLPFLLEVRKHTPLFDARGADACCFRLVAFRHWLLGPCNR